MRSFWRRLAASDQHQSKRHCFLFIRKQFLCPAFLFTQNVDLHDNAIKLVYVKNHLKRVPRLLTNSPVFGEFRTELTMQELSDVKKRFRQALTNNARMSVKGMAEASGLSERAVRRLCDPSDSTKIDFVAAYRICNEYGLSLDHMAFGFSIDGDLSPGARWQLTMQWWSSNLSDKQKHLLLELMEVVWQEGVDRATSNPQMKTP